MFYCGLYYESGIGVAADAATAVAWCTRAAEAGDVGAQYNLGCCFREGIGVAADAAAAVKWYMRAADAGHIGATCNLAICYTEDAGVAVDFAKSVALFTRAAEAGDAIAQFNLGLNHLYGICGAARNVAKAREWFARAAAGGVAQAAAKLAALDAAAPP